MHQLSKNLALVLGLTAAGAAFPSAALADESPSSCYFESRSGVNVECGIYPSEIGNSDAYVQTVVNRDNWPRRGKRGKHGRRHLQPIILDVRSTPEYKAGHPEYAYNAPYPYIYQYCNDVDDDGDEAYPDGLVDNDRRPDGACVSGGDRIDQPAEDFVSYVERIAPDRDTPIFTMCRTGVRSVGAANRLTEAGYTNVRNMWEGFVGIYLTAPQYVFDEDGNRVFWDDDGDSSTEEVPLVENASVDLNHDGVFTDEDKNGWLYHQGLPYEKRLHPYLIYWPDAHTYKWD